MLSTPWANYASAPVMAALRHRDLRLLLAGLAVSKAGDWLYVVGLQVFVFEATRSAAWVAATTVLRLVPAGLLAPVGGALADRLDRRRVMVASDAARAVLMVVLALVAARSGPPAVALAIAFCASAAGSPYLPAAGAMTPELVPESELAAANSALGVVDNVAIVAGPAIGGLLLVLGTPAAAFAVNAVSFAGSALAVAALRARPRVTGSRAGFAGHVLEGVGAVLGSPGTAVVCGFVAAGSLLYGLQTVLLLLVAAERLGGADSYGYLLAAFGAGGVAAGLVAGRIAGFARPSLVLTAALAALGLPLAALALVTSVPLAMPLLAVQGAANIVVDVTAFTLLQRALPEALLARVFGMLEASIVASILAGAVIAPWLEQTAGLSRALLIAGIAVPAAGTILLPLTKDLNLAALRAFAATRERYQALAGLRLFEGVPRPALELLARGARVDEAQPGAVIVREGEPADAVYAVDLGFLDVAAGGRHLARLGRGDYFGEIGILHGVPRTATVTAATPVRVYRMAAADFLAAVNGSPSLSGMVLDGVAARLARGGALRQAQPA